MFSDIDKLLSDTTKDYSSYLDLIGAQSDRMVKLTTNSNVECYSITAEDIEIEMETLKNHDDFLKRISQKVDEITRELDELEMSHDLSHGQDIISRQPVESDSSGWFKRLLRRKETEKNIEPSLNVFQDEKFSVELQKRRELLNTIVESIEKTWNNFKDDLDHWSFRFKIIVVDISRAGSEKYFVELSLYESLVSIFSNYASQYGDETLKLSLLRVNSVDEVSQLSEEIGAILHQSLSEEFKI